MRRESLLCWTGKLVRTAIKDSEIRMDQSILWRVPEKIQKLGWIKNLDEKIKEAYGNNSEKDASNKVYGAKKPYMCIRVGHTLENNS